MTTYSLERIHKKDDWVKYPELLRAAAIAQLEGKATAERAQLGPDELFTLIWFRYDEEGTARAAAYENATHVKVTWEKTVME